MFSLMMDLLLFTLTFLVQMLVALTCMWLIMAVCDWLEELLTPYYRRVKAWFVPKRLGRWC